MECDLAPFKPDNYYKTNDGCIVMKSKKEKVLNLYEMAYTYRGFRCIMPISSENDIETVSDIIENVMASGLEDVKFYNTTEDRKRKIISSGVEIQEI